MDFIDKEIKESLSTFWHQSSISSNSTLKNKNFIQNNSIIKLNNSYNVTEFKKKKISLIYLHKNYEMKAFDRSKSYDLVTKSDYFDAAMKRMDLQLWENLEVQLFWFYFYKFLFYQHKLSSKESNLIFILSNLDFIIT